MRNLGFPLLMRRAALCATLLIAAASISCVRAQGINSSGTDFWVGFFPNQDATGSNQLVELFLASTAADTALVTYDGKTTAWPLSANSVATIDLNARGITDIPEQPLDRSVHVQSHSPITVYGFYDVYGQGNGGSPDGFLGLPTNSLGTEYYTLNYTEYRNFAGTEHSQFLIIAPYDSTIVTITSKSHTLGSNGMLSHTPGQTWSVTLMKGQSYLVQSSGFFSGVDDLTGSHVVSSKPVALMTGHQMADIPLPQPSADYLIEMEPSCDKWGTEYFEMPLAGRTICGDYMRIVSAEDGNIITANGSIIDTLNRGEWTDIDTVTQPQVYGSLNGRRFLVGEYAYSNHYLGDTAEIDPFFILLTGREAFEHTIVFRTPDPAQGPSYKNYLTILAPPNEMSQISINGQAATSYPSAGSATFPGSPIGALRILLPDGSRSYIATSKNLFGMYQYGISSYEGYGWPAGLSLGTHSTDTLPPVQTISASCDRYDVTISELRKQPQYSFVDSKIADITMITQNGDPRWPKASYNYKFAVAADFRAGDSVSNFSLTQIDPTKPAYAAIYVADISGNDTVYEYRSSAIGGITSLHREITSGAIYQQVTVPLVLNLTDTSYIRASWNSFSGITATVSFDATKLGYSFYAPPSGWKLASIQNNGGSVTINITNNSGQPTPLLDLGSMMFTVRTPDPGETLLSLDALDLKIDGVDNALCLTKGEDAMWAVIVQQGMASVDEQKSHRITVRPNPFGDRIMIDDPEGAVTSVEIFDALGRLVVRGQNAEVLQTASLVAGSYVVVCHTREGVQSTHVTKTH
jgi:hypothetical protein